MELLQREYAAGRGPLGWPSFTKQLFYKIASEPIELLAGYHEMSEGLEHRLKRSFSRLSTLEVDHLLEALKTKRYTRTKLQRMLLAVLLGHRKELLTPDKLRSGVQYLRVLGYTGKGRELLKRMKTAARLPVIHTAARPPQPFPYLELDIRATSIYSLAWPKATSRDCLRDYYEKPVTL
jgi:predicted nucleotidyltransferase